MRRTIAIDRREVRRLNSGIMDVLEGSNMRANGKIMDNTLVADSLNGKALAETPEAQSSLPASLESVIGVFKDNPLMDELMEMIREERKAEIEANAA